MDINKFVTQYWNHIATQNEEDYQSIFTKMPVSDGIIQMSNLMSKNF